MVFRTHYNDECPGNISGSSFTCSTVFLHSCRFLCYPPLNKNETALHCQEGRFCYLQHEKRGLLRSLSGDEKGGQHWRKTVSHPEGHPDDCVRKNRRVGIHSAGTTFPRHMSHRLGILPAVDRGTGLTKLASSISRLARVPSLLARLGGVSPRRGCRFRSVDRGHIGRSSRLSSPVFQPADSWIEGVRALLQIFFFR